MSESPWTMVSGGGTLRAAAALSVKDWRPWSDIDEMICGVKKEIERRDWRKSLNL